MNFLTLVMFHLKIYSKNRYFITTMLTTTFAMILIQYIIAYANNNLDDQTIWLRSGIFGMWTTVVTSAGMINFQKFQGTLPYLLSNKVSDNLSMIALIFPCSLFGLLAFPLSYIVCLLCGIYVDVISLQILMPMVLLFIGALCYTIVIAPLFVLTRSAIIYEQLISIPVLLISGVFLLRSTGNNIIEYSKWINPIATPITTILYDDKIAWLQYIVAICIWLVFAYTISKYIFNLVRKYGKVEVI